MASIVIHHTVKDYSAWRPIYDEHEKSRTSAGITTPAEARELLQPGSHRSRRCVSKPSRADGVSRVSTIPALASRTRGNVGPVHP